MNAITSGALEEPIPVDLLPGTLWELLGQYGVTTLGGLADLAAALDVARGLAATSSGD